MPVAKLKADPVAALELLVDLYLDPEIASPRKVSVWYAFWGEANSRQEYYDICGQKDEGFAVLVRELIGRLIELSGQSHLDPDGIALGLIGVLEMLWQDFAFRSENDIDRPAAKARCMAYLRSIFPGEFSGPRTRSGEPSSVSAGFAAWAYASDRAWSLERESLFRDSWQIVAHESQVPKADDFLTADLGLERIVLLRDGFGGMHALRNSCPQLPHTLLEEHRGHLAGGIIECPVHGLRFGADGRRRSGGDADLAALEVSFAAGFYWVRAQGGAADPSTMPQVAATRLARTLEEGRVLRERADLDVHANWKLVAEQWLDRLPARAAAGADALETSIDPLGASPGWSTARYRRLAGSGSGEPWAVCFLAPNQLIERRPDGLSVLQIIPTGPAQCRIRRIHVARGTVTQEERAAGALQYLAGRLVPRGRGGCVAIAESAQRGLSEFGYRVSAAAPSAAVAWFRRGLAARLPELADERPPSESRRMNYNRPTA